MDGATPSHLWSGADADAGDGGATEGGQGAKKAMTTRVPAFRARKVSWKRPGATPRCTGRRLPSVRFFVGGDELNGHVDGAVWPRGMRRLRRLRRLSFGDKFTGRCRTFPGPAPRSENCRSATISISRSTASLCRRRWNASAWVGLSSARRPYLVAGVARVLVLRPRQERGLGSREFRLARCGCLLAAVSRMHPIRE